MTGVGVEGVLPYAGIKLPSFCNLLIIAELRYLWNFIR